MISLTFWLSLWPALAVSAPSPALSVSPNGGKIEFLAVGKPSFIKISGTGSEPRGSLTINEKVVNGNLELDLGTLDTGIGLRNDHMKNKYLKVKDHPTSKFEFVNLQLVKAWSLKDPQVTEREFRGNLTLHGVQKPVVGTFQVSPTGKTTADFAILLTDFGIEIPKYLGVTVADEVKIKVVIDKFSENGTSSSPQKKQ